MELGDPRFDVALADWLAARGGAEATPCTNTEGPVQWTAVHDAAWRDGECTGSSFLPVVFLAQDACGQQVSTGATFHLEDTTSPKLVVAPKQDLTSERGGPNASASAYAWATATRGGGVAADLGSDVAWIPIVPDIRLPGSGCGNTRVEVQFDVKDACGNTVRTQAAVKLVDSAPPHIYRTPLRPALDASVRPCSAIQGMRPGVLGGPVCATSKANNGECTRRAGYFTAAGICASAGARLCRRNEVVNGRKTGCGLDYKHVWTATRCTTHDLQDGYVTAYGGGSDLDGGNAALRAAERSHLGQDDGYNGYDYGGGEDGPEARTGVGDRCQVPSDDSPGVRCCADELPAKSARSNADLVEHVSSWLLAHGHAAAKDAVDGENLSWSWEQVSPLRPGPLITVLPNSIYLTASNVVTSKGSVTQLSGDFTFKARDNCSNAATALGTFVIEDARPFISTLPLDVTIGNDGRFSGDQVQAWLQSNGGAAVGPDFDASMAEWSYQAPENFSPLNPDSQCSDGSKIAAFTVRHPQWLKAVTMNATATVRDVKPPTLVKPPSDTLYTISKYNTGQVSLATLVLRKIFLLVPHSSVLVTVSQKHACSAAWV